MKKKKSNDTYLILHNIRSAHNVGAIFRTADAVGVREILLSGYTPLPTDRFGRARRDIAKTALGAEEQVSWKHITSLATTLEEFKRREMHVVAVEQAKGATDYKKLTVRYPAVFIFGNEVHGLSKNILNRCDSVVEIPMKGKKESLNVSVAVGIVLFRVLNV